MSASEARTKKTSKSLSYNPTRPTLHVTLERTKLGAVLTRFKAQNLGKIPYQPREERRKNRV